jgi:hypothetical protein
MAGLDPAIHVFVIESLQDVDARDEPAHDKKGHDSPIAFSMRRSGTSQIAATRT